jgi:hypothetical protein
MKRRQSLSADAGFNSGLVGGSQAKAGFSKEPVDGAIAGSGFRRDVMGGTVLPAQALDRVAMAAAFSRDVGGGHALSAQALDRVALASWPAVYEAMRSHEWEVEVTFLDGDGGCLDLDGPGVRSQVKKDAEAAAKGAKRAGRGGKER